MNEQNRRRIYLDHSATTPVDPRVAEVIHQTLTEQWGNPSSLYSQGREAKIVLEKAREQVAELMSADPKNVFFTSGGTEADNLALKGVMLQARHNGSGNHLVVSAIEHSAIAKTADFLEEEEFEVSRLPVNSDGLVSLSDLEQLCRDETVMVSVMHVNNEIGTIQPIAEIAEFCHSRNILFHTDAVQSFGKIVVDVQTMQLDLVSVSSHKIYGPKGVGALYIRSGIEIQPVQRGGGQEKGIRTGTENMPGIAGFGKAVEICSTEIQHENSRLASLRDSLLKQLKSEVRDGFTVNGSLEHRLGANLNVAFPGVEADSLLLALDLDGISISTGSACSSGSTKPSAVLTALGLDDQTAHASIRVTLGRSNTADDVHYAGERIAYHVNRLRDMAF